VTSPEQRDYRLALELAAKALAAQHSQEIARRSGAFVQEVRGRIFLEVEVLGRRCVVSHPNIRVTAEDPHGDIPSWEQVLILHYLERASGVPLSGNLVTFQEVESGSFYLPLYRERVIKPLVEAFGHRPQAMVEVAERFFNGERRGFADASVTVLALPYVPVTLLMWLGDSEFPSQGSLMYDASVASYLPTEDITSVSQMLVQRLIEADQRK
jgi:hypothetical protein